MFKEYIAIRWAIRFNPSLIIRCAVPNYGRQGYTCGTAMRWVAPWFWHRRAGGAGEKGPKVTGVLRVFSSSHPIALRTVFLNVQLQVIPYFLLKIQSLVDFYSPNLIPVSQRQKPHLHRLHLSNWCVLFLCGKRVWRGGGKFEEFSRSISAKEERA